MELIKEDIGKRFRQVRIELKMDQMELADHLECDIIDISHIENGAILICNLLVYVLQKKFNVNEDWLYTGEGSMFIDAKEKEIDIEDFGEYADEITYMLRKMKRYPAKMHGILSDFFSNLRPTEYKL